MTNEKAKAITSYRWSDLTNIREFQFPRILYDTNYLCSVIENHKDQIPIVFYAIASFGDPEYLRLMLEMKKNMIHRLHDGATLGFAAVIGIITSKSYKFSAEKFQIIVDGGFDINEQDSFGETAIALATNHECLELVRKLYDLGADPNIKTKQGINAIGYLISDNYQIARYIINPLTDFKANSIYQNTSVLQHHSNHPKVLGLMHNILN